MIDSTRSIEEISANLHEIIDRVHLSEQRLMILLNKADISGGNQGKCSCNNFVSIWNLIVSYAESKGLKAKFNFLTGFDSIIPDSSSIEPHSSDSVALIPAHVRGTSKPSLPHFSDIPAECISTCFHPSDMRWYSDR